MNRQRIQIDPEAFPAVFQPLLSGAEVYDSSCSRAAGVYLIDKDGGFIDLDTAGTGDKHVDLFWGMWSLQFSLKTDRYRDRFLDAYGRNGIEGEVFRIVAACEVFG